jgi:signal transduction histidine kinase/ActR/RegA family two-component response regulator
LLDAPQTGAVLLTGSDGDARPYGFVPRSAPPAGLFVGVELAPVPASGVFTDRERKSFLLMALGTLMSFSLAMIVGQIFVRRPTNALLDAARRWSIGDLDARVNISSGRNSEFGKLAQAFNAMAAALSRQRIEATELLDTLEARVAARTEDLLKSRDQLQVAMAQHAKSEASLNQMQKLQAVGQLAGGIAHDFNNLLTAVISALEMLRMRLPAEDERSHRLLDNALHAADRGGRLTSKLLSFSRRQLLVPVPIDLNTVLLGMVSLLTTTLGSRIRIETGLAPALWPALADPNQVESAILNLALNARDAMPNGGTLRISTINVAIPAPTARSGDAARLAGVSQLAARSLASPASGRMQGPEDDGIVVSQPPISGDFVMIRVSDTGIGMPPEVLARVFEPFFTTKKQGRGTGLGLSQVHGLAAQSGGEVRLSSEPGLGTTVSLLLPRAENPAAAVTSGGRVPGAAKVVGLQILLVDDDVDVRSLTAEMLAELGHRPLSAAGADDALQMLEDEAGIDVLLTDYAMPGMDGLELIDLVRQRWPGIRAILITGHAEIDLSKHAQMHPVLTKPFTMADLSQVLESMRLHHDGSIAQPSAAD